MENVIIAVLAIVILYLVWKMYGSNNTNSVKASEDVFVSTSISSPEVETKNKTKTSSMNCSACENKTCAYATCNNNTCSR